MPTTKRKTKTAKYELFHSSGDFFWESLRYGRYGPDVTAEDLRNGFLQGKYELMQTFEKPAEAVNRQLEDVFGESQNVEDHWRLDAPCRSTSVGDLVRVGKDYWIVAGVGFVLGWQD
jgi:hypothetical protein